MIKRFLSLCIAVTILTSAFVVSFQGAENSVCRGVNIELPKVNFEISGRHNKDDIIKATLSNRTLKINDSRRASKDDKELVYIVFDTSSQMKKYSSGINKIKKSLKKYLKRFNSDDKVVLLTFDKKYKKLLKGKESYKNKLKKLSTVKPGNSGSSRLFKTLRYIYDETEYEKDYDRKYAIVISDGVDRDNGGTTSYSRLSELYKTHNLPLYGVCLTDNNTKKSSYIDFSSLCNRGGVCKTAKNKTAAKVFNKLKKDKINNVTLFFCESDANSSVGSSKLFINLKNQEKKITVKAYVVAKEDNIAPKVESIEYDKESNSFEIRYSENVSNADKSDSYTITASNGSPVTFETPVYEGRVATLHLNSTLFTGDYKFEFRNICDTSDDKNPLLDKELTRHIEAQSFVLHVLKIIGIILIPIAFLAALFLILLFMKKKKNVKRFRDIFIAQVEEIENEQVHIEQKKSSAKRISIFIYEGNGNTRRIDYNLNSSMIVGRSDLCDLVIEDAQMSRQHFVVEDVETGLAVTDLGTTNGTNINGIPIKSRTFLSSGDKITAGETTITINYTR